MNCSHCGHDQTKVIDSRDWEQGIRRRRECLSCTQRFTTVEAIVLNELLVVKKDGTREEFDLSKILVGVRKACEKRPIPSGAIETMVAGIQQDAHKQGKTEIPTSVVGELVMDHLKKMDHIAYIRFASVYRSFTDVSDLKRELAALEAGWQKVDVPDGQMPLIPESKPSRQYSKTLRPHRRHSKSQQNNEKSRVLSN